MKLALDECEGDATPGSCTYLMLPSDEARIRERLLAAQSKTAERLLDR